PVYLHEFNGLLAYCADDGVHGHELWVAAAAPGSEVLFAEFLPGPQGSQPDNVVAFGGGLLCTAWSPATGTELFFTDGATNTGIVGDLYPGPDGSAPVGLTVFGNQVLFSADDQVYGVEP